MSTPAILNSIGCMLFGKKPTLHCFLIDEAKLTAAKEQAYILESIVSSMFSADETLGQVTFQNFWFSELF
jgi:hypothetical protein